MLTRLKRKLTRRKPKRPRSHPKYSRSDITFGGVWAVLLAGVVVFGALAWIAAESKYERHVPAVSRCGPYDFEGGNGEVIPGTADRVSDYWSGFYRLMAEESSMWIIAYKGLAGVRWCRVVSGLSRNEVRLGSLENGAVITISSGYERCLLAVRIQASTGKLESAEGVRQPETPPSTPCDPHNSIGAGINPAMFYPQPFRGSLAGS